MRYHKALAQLKEGVEGTVLVLLWGSAASVFDPSRASMRGDATATRGACAAIPYESIHSIDVIDRVGSRCGRVFVEKKTWRHFQFARKKEKASSPEKARAQHAKDEYATKRY